MNLPEGGGCPPSVHNPLLHNCATTLQSGDHDHHLLDREKAQTRPEEGPGAFPHKYYRYICTIASCDTADLFAPISCGDPLCLQCARWRQRTYRKYVEKRVNEVLHIHHGKLRMVTLTVKSSFDLEDRFNHLKDSFRELRRRRIWKDNVVAALAGYEVTYSDSEGWHVHVHLISTGTYMPQPLLKKAWSEITGDSDIVDIRKIDGYHGAMKEVLKYPFKPTNSADWEEAIKHEFRRVIHGRRLYETFGAWYGDKMIEKGGGCCPGCGGRYTLWEVLNFEDNAGYDMLCGDSYPLREGLKEEVLPPPGEGER